MNKENYESLAITSDYNAEQIEMIHNSVAKGVDFSDLAYFLSFCKEVGLSPVCKEVWCFKNSDGDVIVTTGRDGLLKKAQENPDFAGIRSSEVRENDSIEVNIPEGIIKHTYNPKDDRGKVVGGYAFVFRKDGEPTVEYADFDDYSTNFGLWISKPVDMMKKVPEAKALKKAFGLSGIQIEYEFKASDGVISPVMSKAQPLLGKEEFDIVVDYMAKSDLIKEAVLGKYKGIENMPRDKFKSFVEYAKSVLK